VILESDNEDLIRQKEIDTIKELNLLDTSFGYNVSPGGNYQTEEVRKQIGESVKSLWEDPEYRQHMTLAAKNRTYSNKRNEKISNSLK
jgi:hypothetical protein